MTTTPRDPIERLLHEQAPAARVPAPCGLRTRVLDELAAARPSVPPRRRRALPLVLPMSLAAAAALAFSLLPAPSPRPAPSAVALTLSLDPSPVIRPAARLLSGSIDQPLRDQATALVRETRRATDLVIDCLPFARGG
jgi:hypothetical protein